MIRKAPSQQPDHVQVTFELPPNLWAARIYLVGEFNQWDAQATPLCQERDGMWRVALDLPAGSAYEFRYLIDGRWQLDFYADSFSSSDHLAQNSVVWAVLPTNPEKSPCGERTLHPTQIEPTPYTLRSALIPKPEIGD